MNFTFSIETPKKGYSISANNKSIDIIMNRNIELSATVSFYIETLDR